MKSKMWAGKTLGALTGICVGLGGVSCHTDGRDVIQTPYFSFEQNSQDISITPTTKCSGYFLLARDTIYYHAGNFIWTVTEEEPRVAVVEPGNEHYYSLKGVMVARSPDFDVDNFRKQNVFFKELRKVKCKLVLPRIDGVGVTGLYVDSLTRNDGGKVAFNMYGINLSATQQANLVEIFESLRFEKRLTLCDNSVIE